MLNVRYGSGCNLIHTAWAARPSFWRSRHSKSATPSSGVSRPPSTAFDKMRSMVADIACPLGYQTEFGGEFAVAIKARQFPLAEVVVNDVREVAAAEAGIEIQRRGFALGDASGVCHAIVFCS